MTVQDRAPGGQRGRRPRSTKPAARPFDAENETYRGDCTIDIANRSPKTLLPCDDDLGGDFAIVETSFVDTAAWMADDVRKNCF